MPRAQLWRHEQKNLQQAVLRTVQRSSPDGISIAQTEVTCSAFTAQMAVAEHSTYQAMISELVVPQLNVQFTSALVDLICIRQRPFQMCALCT